MITVKDSSGKQCKEQQKDKNNRLLGIASNCCILFGSESTMSMCGELDSDCTVVTLSRVANFRVKHLNSDTESKQA